MSGFFDGSILMAFCVAALCFLKFWRKTHDRFFLLFSLAFWIMGVNRLVMVMLSIDRTVPNEDHTAVYLVRLLAFVILLLAIIDKNRKPRAGELPPANLGGPGEP